MCGFIGAITKKQKYIDHLPLACTLLQHRGPDDERFYNDNEVHLGFRRLSIIDVAGSPQPVVSDDGKIILVFNGEIYNFKELRSALQQKGFVFHTNGDAEVVLNMYRAHGPAMVQQLNGIFAIALYDKKEKATYLFRDQFGIKPLFYHRSPDGLFFSSELNALKKAAGPFKLNRDILYHFFSMLYIPAPWTIYKNVQAVEPGHYVQYQNGTVTQQRYFQLSFQAQKMPDYKERVQDALNVAVKRQLLSDVPLGFFLSGGIDSSLIALSASKLLGKDMKTFTAVINDPALNEQTFAKQVADKIGSQHFELEVSGFNLQDSASIIPRYGQPFADTSLLPTYRVSQLIRQHVTVVLGGDGADELLNGYNRYSLAADTHLAAEDFFNQSYFRVSEKFKKQYILASNWQSSTYFLLRDHLQLQDSLQPLELMRYLDTRFFLEGDILAKVDISSMAHSVEARVPFLDPDFVHLTTQLPDSALRDQKTNKKVLKELLLDSFPPEFVFRPKIGFMLPIEKWISTLAKQLSQQWDQSPLEALHYFESDKIKLLLDQPQHSFESAYFIFGLYALNVWLHDAEL